jgi:hypothetical protein
MVPPIFLSWQLPLRRQCNYGMNSLLIRCESEVPISWNILHGLLTIFSTIYWQLSRNMATSTIMRFVILFVNLRIHSIIALPSERQLSREEDRGVTVTMVWKVKKWWSTIPPLLTVPLILDHWTQKRPRHRKLKIHVWSWNGHTNVPDLNRLMVPTWSLNKWVVLLYGNR